MINEDMLSIENNQKWWENLLVGKKITKINFSHSNILNKNWLSSIELDSGETVHIVDGTVMVRLNGKMEFADQKV